MLKFKIKNLHNDSYIINIEKCSTSIYFADGEIDIIKDIKVDYAFLNKNNSNMRFIIEYTFNSIENSLSYFNINIEPREYKETYYYKKKLANRIKNALMAAMSQIKMEKETCINLDKYIGDLKI